MTLDGRKQKQDEQTWGSVQLCIIFFCLNILLRLLLAITFPVFYEEAYYWEWSRVLSLGYLDHPPMVAYIIRLSTEIFGSHSLFGIRFSAILLETGSLLLMYRLALILFDDKKIASRSLLLGFALPLMNATGVLILPEAPFLFFQLLFLNLFASAFRSGKTRYWCLAGIALGLALLSKLEGTLLLAASAWFLISKMKNRVIKYTWQPILTLFLALLTWSPFLYWNSINGWATFRLWFFHYPFIHFKPSFFKILEVLFEQLVNISFLLAIPMLGLFFVRQGSFPQSWRSGYRLLRLQFMFPFVFFFFVGFLTETHPNMTLLAYPQLCVALAAWSVAKPKHIMTRHLKCLTITTLVILVILSLFTLFALDTTRNLKSRTPERGFGKRLIDSQVRVFGLSKLAEKLKDSSEYKDKLLFTNNFRLASVLSFELQEETVVNIHPLLNQTPYLGDAQLFYIPWASLAGKKGVFITRTKYKEKMYSHLQELFTRVEEMEPLEVELSSGRSIYFFQFLVSGFCPPTRNAMNPRD